MNREFAGKVGFERQWDSLSQQYEWADLGEAKQFARRVMSHCETCQACQRAGNLRSMIEHTSIPPAVMQSVALDAFMMPPVMSNSDRYDCIVVCVDKSAKCSITPEEDLIRAESTLALGVLDSIHDLR